MTKKQQKLPRICLNMIVKNEGHVIEECLQSIVHLVDYYVINDTGSTDDTKEKIRNFFKKHNIKGEIHDHEFRTCTCHPQEYKRYDHFHFGWNRTWALDKCVGKSEYIFIMDADDVLEGNFKFPPKLVADQYYLKIKTDFNTYMRPQLIKNHAKFKWRYEDGLHEFLKSDAPNQIIHHIIDEYTIHSRRLGNRNKDIQKYQKDCAFLKVLMAERPDYVRYKHYYAQSLYDALLYNESIAAYQDYISKETFIEGQYFARLMIGKAHMKLKSPDDQVIAAFEECFKHHPDYAEPMYELCRYLNSVNKYEEAYTYGKKAVWIPIPQGRILSVDHDVYNFKLLDEMIWCCTETKRHQEAIFFSRRLLKQKRLTPEQQSIINDNIRVLSNMGNTSDGMQDLLKKFENKFLIAIYLGQSPLEGYYGSELAAFKLAASLAKAPNTQVVIFCDGIEKIKTQDNVMFLPSLILKSWNRNQNMFDVMIVSRYINYFIEVNSKIAKKTFMWLHDVMFHSYYNCGYLPEEAHAIVQNTKDLIDGYVCSSPWHKSHLINFYNLPPDKIHIIGLGIDGPKCQKALDQKLPRKKNRFIWISDWRRNLPEFVQQFMLIKAYMEDAELHIYREIPDDMKKDWVKLDYIKFHGYQDNDKVLEGLSQADFFCYVTEFKETYCLSAHEAQAMGCICITSPTAALESTVADRGILLRQNNLAEILLKLTQPEKDDLRSKAQTWALSQNWDQKATEWQALFQLDTNIAIRNTKLKTPKMFKRLEILKKFNFNPKVILDIGANIGEWNEVVQEIFPQAHIYSYEANPKCCQVLKEKNLHYTNTLLGNETKEVEFYVHNSDSFGSGASIYKEASQYFDASNIINLPMQRLDDIYPSTDHPHVDLMKIDVQGAELDVIKGARQVLQNTDFVILEASIMRYNAGSPLIGDIIETMKAEGFLVFDIVENHYLNDCNIQADILFLNKNSPFTSSVAKQNSEVSYLKTNDIYA